MAFPTNFVWYVHKYDVGLVFGGSEEGGWWYTAGMPVEDWKPRRFTVEWLADECCRSLNVAEKQRREDEEQYDFTSVLSHRSDHYEYDVTNSAVAEPFPQSRPHYE